MGWLRIVGSILIVLLACIGFDYASSAFIDDYIVRLFFLAGLYVTLSVSLNLINGITGQFSIGHAAFYMVGSYTAMLMSRAFYDAQPFGPSGWLVCTAIGGGIMAGVVGLVVGLPSLRLRGDYLAIVTLGFGEILRILVVNQESWGGSMGTNLAPKHQALWLVLLLAALCVGVCRNLLQTAHGLSFLAIREDEVAAQAMGVNVTKTKVMAFVIGSAFAGAAGALFAHNEGFITPEMYKMEVSFLILTMVVLGGTGSITGSVVSALALFAIPELSRVVKFEVSLGYVLGFFLALMGYIWATKWVTDNYHKSKNQRVIAYLGVAGGALVGGLVLGTVLNFVPQFASEMFDANKLKMVVLAITLLTVMLLRPQGMFGHAEFGWGRIFKKRENGVEVGA